MDPEQGSYAFRWARGLAIALQIAAGAMIAGVAAVVWGVIVEPGSWWILLIAGLPVLLAAVFVAVFASRLSSAFVALQTDGLRVSYPLSVDTTIPFEDIESAEVVNHHLIYGLGIRTNLVGHVALATASGPAAELTLRRPLRAGILPKIWWTHARELRLTVEQPQTLVAQLSARLTQEQRGGVQ